MKIFLSKIDDIIQLNKTMQKCVGIVDLRQDHYVVNAKSLMGCFSLDWGSGVEIVCEKESDEEFVKNFMEEVKNK